MSRHTIRAVVCLLGCLGLTLPAAADDTDALIEGLLGDGGGAAKAKPSRKAKQRKAEPAKAERAGKAKSAKGKGAGKAKRAKAKRGAKRKQPKGQAEVVGDPAAEQAPPRRKVVITDFVGPSGQAVRQSVLEVFSEQRGLEVAGYNDVKVVAKRLGVDPKSEHGREALAAELAIDGWVDGRITDNGAAISLSDAAGARVAAVSLQGRSAGSLRTQAVEKVWPGLGPFLSAAERERQLLTAFKKAAEGKVQAREDELARQREIAHERLRRREQRLQQARQLAHDKQASRDEERLRQRKLAGERRLVAEQERERLEAQQREQLAEQQRLLREQELARQQQLAKQQQQQAWGAKSSQSWSGSQPAMASGGQTAPAGVSPETQRWLEQRRAAGQAPAPAQPPTVQPTPQPPGAEPTPSVDPSTLSPATRKWLEERRRRGY